MKIMNEVSFLGAHDEINTVTLDDPALFKYPIAYLIEVGWWTVTDARSRGTARLFAEGRLSVRRRLQTARLARCLPGGGWEPFAETMRRVLPDVQFIDMVPSDRRVPYVSYEINDVWINSRRPTSTGIQSSKASSRITIAASG